MPIDDVIGAFEVRDGRIRPDACPPMPDYQLLTENGFPQYPPPLETALIDALRELASNT